MAGRPDSSNVPGWRAEPRWYARRVMAPHVPPHWRAWLFDPASLTKRLVAVCKGRFRVRLLGQRFDRAMLSEAHALSLTGSHHALVREVRLLCDEAVWVYARTVIPSPTLVGANCRLAHLGERSLGAVLFADPTMERGEVQIARVLPGQRLFQLMVAQLSDVPDEIWGRRSVFRLRGHPLLVSEFFLPTLKGFAP